MGCHSQQDSGLQTGKLFQSQKCYEGKKPTKTDRGQRRIVQKIKELGKTLGIRTMDLSLRQNEWIPHLQG